MIRTACFGLKSLTIIISVITLTAVVAVPGADAEIVRRLPSTDCSSPGEGSPGFDEGVARCNRITGAIAAYATAWVGAAAGQGMLHWDIPIIPPGSETRVNVDIEMIIAHGCVSIGTPQFTGTYLVYATGTESNYTRITLDAWLDTQIAIDKIMGILAPIIPIPGPISNVMDIMGYVQTFMDAMYVQEVWEDGADAGNAEETHINFNYTVGAHQTSMEFWGGVRAQASGFGLGTATSTVAGVVKQIRITGIDPPLLPSMTGPDSVLLNLPVEFQVSCPGNLERVKYSIDWDNGQAREETDFFPADSVITFIHSFGNVNSQYLIDVKAIERDGLESGYADLNLYCSDGKPGEITGVDASDGNHCGMVRVTWDQNGLAEYYTVWIESPAIPVSGLIYGDTWFEDTTAPPGVSRSYYVVGHNIHGESGTFDYNYGHAKELPEPAFSLGSQVSPCSVRLYWDAHSAIYDIEKYDIYRNNIDDFGTATLAVQVPDTCNGDCDYNDLPDSTDTYYYWVVAVNACGEAAPTSSVNESWSGVTPPGPENVSATDDLCAYVEVRFDQYTPYSYRIIRDGVLDPEGSVTSPWEDRDCARDEWHTYVVEAFNSSCDSVPGVRSDPVQGARWSYAGTPQEAVASDGAWCDRVRVDWHPVPDATRYSVYRSDTEQWTSAVWIGEAHGDTLYYDDFSLPANGVTRYYWVRAHTPCDDGDDPSNRASGYRAWSSVAAPTGLVVTDSVDCSIVDVEWAPVGTADFYTLWRDGYSIKQLAGTSYVDQNPPPDTDHQYEVSAGNVCMVSSKTAQVPGRVVDSPPPSPANVDATDGTLCEMVEITWDDAVGASSYKVLYGTLVIADSLPATSFVHHTTYFGGSWDYEVRSQGVCGEGVGASVFGAAGAPAVPPDAVIASDGTSVEGVEIEWQKAPYALGYFVLRDGVEIGTTANRLFVDQYALPASYHMYSVVSYTTCDTSAPSVPDTGFVDPSALLPRFIVEEIELFQDAFPDGGVAEGPGRADMAFDILPPGSPGILPGDSVCVTVVDTAGVDFDPLTGGPAVYCYVRVNSFFQPGIKSGDLIIDDDARWPVTSIDFAGGYDWTVVRMDTVFTGPGRTGAVADRYCVDLNDTFFESGDTVLYFFHAQSFDDETYWTEAAGHTRDIEEAAANPMEFQVLPGGGFYNGGSILYVDGSGSDEARMMLETSFQMLGIDSQVDRYDIRDPAACAGNTPGRGDVSALIQLIPIYQSIIWNTGDRESCLLADGTGKAGKSDDFLLLYEFVDQHYQWAGVYLSGNNVAEEWNSLAGPSADQFKTYIPHELRYRTQLDAPGIGYNPRVLASTGGVFDDGLGETALWLASGYMDVVEFDVLNATGASNAEMRYDAQWTAEKAVVANTMDNYNGVPVTVILSAFSFHRIRDEDNGGTPERARHLRDILNWFGNPVGDPVGAGAAGIYTDRLAQNHPNPFNPVTAIEFSLRTPEHVTLSVYNVKGQLIRTLVDEPRKAGFHKDVKWNGSNAAGAQVASGIYFYRLMAGDFVETKKMVLLK